ncbi:Dehydrogenase/reductase SDR family member 7 [Folsomia candida]|uniref:Dehydrogenase/reductase SDR family member 7 n=1 Tax=Folsomia candida TaxID=158441 RepID=A0A226EYL7_FOLCA|nr:Dehydrogenase/reductase SDR family member 7 [Folsomia candida]
MDWVSLFGTILCILCISVFIVMCIGDSDVLTALYCYIGIQPVHAFRDKVIWITGGSSGIGEAIAKELAKCNSAKIVLSARRKEELLRVKSECLGKNNLDVLISNAGRSQRAAWPQTELAVDKDLFELNVFSLLNLNRIVVRHFLEVGRGGQLAIMSSIAAKMGVYHSGSYSGSKFALHGYFNSLRNETYTDNIDVTLICPGPVFSPILRNAFTSKLGQVVDQEYTSGDRRMTADRCAYLSLIAIGNRLEETWVALSPIVLFTYLAAYQPYLFSKLSRFVHSNGLYFRARGAKDR